MTRQAAPDEQLREHVDEVGGLDLARHPDREALVGELVNDVGPAPIASGSPWENGYIERLNARLRDELLDGEIFYSLREAQIIIESRRRHYNTVRPHASLGYRPPAPEVFVRASPITQAAPNRL